MSYTWSVDTAGTLNTGLVCYHGLNGDVTDYSGNGHNGTNSGAAFVSGRDGRQCLDFEASEGDYVTFDDIPDMTDCSISAWVNTESTGSSKSIYCKDQDGNRAFEFFVSANNEYLNFSPGGGGSESTTGVTSATWKHVLVTYSDSANQTKYYINGSLVGTLTDTTSMATSAANLLMGIRNYSGSPDHQFDGLIQDGAIWNKVLSSTEISDLAGGAYMAVAASGPANMKTWDGVAKASIKTINGVAIASVKTINGIN